MVSSWWYPGPPVGRCWADTSLALWLGQKDLGPRTAQGGKQVVVYPNWTGEIFWKDPNTIPSILSSFRRGYLRSPKHSSWVEWSLFPCGLARKLPAGWPRGWLPWLEGWMTSQLVQLQGADWSASTGQSSSRCRCLQSVPLQPAAFLIAACKWYDLRLCSSVLAPGYARFPFQDGKWIMN